MLDTSRFCGGCGSEITGDNWKSLIIRPYCEDCKPNFALQRFFPIVCLSFGLAGIIYSFGSCLKNSNKPVNLITTPIVETASNKNRSLQNQSNLQISKNTNAQNSPQKAETNNDSQTNSQILVAPAGQKPTNRHNTFGKEQDLSVEAVYICGAQTKKGTACQRRVRGGGRCWQHTGQPAILPPGKLLVSQ